MRRCGLLLFRDAPASDRNTFIVVDGDYATFMGKLVIALWARCWSRCVPRFCGWLGKNGKLLLGPFVAAATIKQFRMDLKDDKFGNVG